MYGCSGDGWIAFGLLDFQFASRQGFLGRCGEHAGRPHFGSLGDEELAHRGKSYLDRDSCCFNGNSIVRFRDGDCQTQIDGSKCLHGRSRPFASQSDAFWNQEPQFGWRHYSFEFDHCQRCRSGCRVSIGCIVDWDNGFCLRLVGCDSRFWVCRARTTVQTQLELFEEHRCTPRYLR